MPMPPWKSTPINSLNTLTPNKLVLEGLCVVDTETSLRARREAALVLVKAEVEDLVLLLTRLLLAHHLSNY